MALERFIPKSPDINIRNGQDFEVAKFGHLNTIVEYINNNSAKPAGLNGYVQFNDNAALGGDAGLFWDNVNKRLGIGTTTPTSKLVVAATSGSLDAIFTTTDATAATTIYEDNNLGKGIRISSYGSTASGTLLDGTINRAGSVVLRTNDTSYPMVFGGISNSSEQYYFGRTGFTLALNTTTNNVTIGASSGTARLFIKGSGSTSATTSLLVQNSAGTNILKIGDGARIDVLGTIGQIDFSSYYQLFSTGNQSTVGCYKGGQAFSVDGSRLCVNVATGSHSASASFQVDSTTTGILPPRMTTTQKNAIATPVAGLVVYDTDLNKLCVYTTAWQTITSV